VEEGWSYFLGGVRNKQVTRITKCTECQLKSVCGMCPANAELEGGDPEKPVEFLCHVAHLRALTFGWPIPPHGECEFCPGGARHEEIAATAARIEVPNRDQAPRRRMIALPMVRREDASTGGGCGSCRH